MTIFTFIFGVNAQEGRLDSTFNLVGTNIINFGSGYDDVIESTIIQPDGKIVVAGLTGKWPAYDMGLARYNIDGTLDYSFGDNGLITTKLGTISMARAIALQKDGKIVVAGGNYSFKVVRYDAYGNLDYSFGSSGVVNTSIGLQSSAFAIAIQSDDKILVAGSASDGGPDADFALARYNTDGSLDKSFNSTGIITTDYSQGDYATSIGIQSDGKIIVAGYTNTAFALSRYKINGTIDSTFGINGKLITKIGSNYSYGKALKIQQDGKIVVAGISNDNSSPDFALVRYKSNGTLDSLFGLDGKVLTDFNSSDDNANSIEIQKDGKIFVAGESQNKIAIARYLSNGILDKTWGGNGKIISNFNGGLDNVYSISLQADGKLVVAGSSYSNGLNDFAIARFVANSNNVEINKSTINPITVYPNPAIDFITVEWNSVANKPFTITVTDMLGQFVSIATLINSSDGNYQYLIPVTNQVNGIYYVQVKSEGYNSITKISVLN